MLMLMELRHSKGKEIQEGRQGRRERTYSAKPVIFLIVAWFLDRISADHGRVPVAIVLFIGCEINLSEELLFMMLEFADHLCLFALLSLPSVPPFSFLRGDVGNKFWPGRAGRENVWAALGFSSFGEERVSRTTTSRSSVMRRDNDGTTTNTMSQCREAGRSEIRRDASPVLKLCSCARWFVSQLQLTSNSQF